MYRSFSYNLKNKLLTFGDIISSFHPPPPIFTSALVRFSIPPSPPSAADIICERSLNGGLENCVCFLRLKETGLPVYLFNTIPQSNHQYNTGSSEDVTTFYFSIQIFLFPIYHSRMEQT